MSFLLKKKEKKRILLDVVLAYNKNQIKEKCACVELRKSVFYSLI